MEYYIDGFQAYLETLCINHKRVQHDPAPGGTKSFIRFHSPDDLNQVPNNPGTTLVIVTRYFGKAIGTMDESAMRQWVQIRFCTYAATPTDGDFTGAIARAQDTAFTVMLDFITRMLHDFRVDDCGPLKGIELDNANWDELPEQPFLENHFGWDLTIPFRSYFPPYNPDAWEPLITI